MNIAFREIRDLPPCAWCVRCKGDRAEVLHGSQVETFADGFVEGAWDGSFAGKSFVDAEWFCGDGGKLSGDSLVLSTATHTLTALYHFKLSRGGG